MRVLDGKQVANSIKKDLKVQIKELKDENRGIPHLTVFQYGENDVSEKYASIIRKNCDKIGIQFTYTKITNNLKDFKNKLVEANNNPKITSIIVQKPYPRELDGYISSIKPHKDTEGITPVSMGKLLLGLDTLVPATAEACLEILNYYQIKLSGKRAVVLGRSNIVGKPVSILLQQENATVTMCHSKTENLEWELKNADIVIVAVGQAEMIKGKMLNNDSIVIDVGTNFINGKLLGDVDFKSAANKVKMITPVPGGVGTVTNQVLMRNIVKSFKNRT